MSTHTPYQDDALSEAEGARERRERTEVAAVNTHTPQWTVGPGDRRYVFVPRLAKPIACGTEERARLVSRSVNVAPKLAEALRALLKESPNQTPAGDAARAALAEWDAQ